MKKLALATCLIALGALGAQSHAQGISLKSIRGGTLGIVVSDHSFDADRDGAFDMFMAGRKLGIVAGFTDVLPGDWYWGADARIAWGATTFSSASRGSNSASPETLLDARIVAGRDFALGSTVVSPYIGLGYRSLESYLKGYTTAGYISPTRSSTLFYLPLGVAHRFRLGPDARITTSIEYDHLLQGTQKTQYTDIVGYTNDLSVTQRKGQGVRFSVARETSRWGAGLYYQYWQIQESEVGTYADATTVYAATEARNVSRELGVQIRFPFD